MPHRWTNRGKRPKSCPKKPQRLVKFLWFRHCTWAQKKLPGGGSLSLLCVEYRPLFIYTDGLNEAENPQREQFGDDRLLDALRRTRFENAQQVIESLKQEVEAFRNGAEPNDDFTMMCLNVS